MPPLPPPRGGSSLTHKLGRRSPTSAQRARAVPLRAFLRPQARPIPETDDYAEKAQSALTQMMNNDREGCCSETAFAKWFGMIASYRPGGSPLVASAAEVSRFYHEVTGPGDNGTVMVEMFEYAMKTGFLIGSTRHKIAGYASIDVTDTELVNAGMHWFEGLQLGVNLTERQYSQFATGSLWTFDGSRVVGGHSIPLTKRAPDRFGLATWAQQPDVTRECVQNPRWAEEAYVCISQDMVDAAGHGANEIDWPVFLSAMEDIKAGRTPNIPDVVPPNPPGPNPPGPNPPGAHEWSHTFTAFGKSLRIYAGYEITDAVKEANRAVNWSLLYDLWSLAEAVASKDMGRIVSAAAKVLADLGIVLPFARIESLARGLQAEYETRPLMEKGPPESGNSIDAESGNR